MSTKGCPIQHIDFSPDYDEDFELEDEEAPECKHEHGTIVCSDCLLPFPGGVEMFEGQVIS